MSIGHRLTAPVFFHARTCTPKNRLERSLPRTVQQDVVFHHRPQKLRRVVQNTRECPTHIFAHLRGRLLSLLLQHFLLAPGLPKHPPYSYSALVFASPWMAFPSPQGCANTLLNLASDPGREMEIVQCGSVSVLLITALVASDSDETRHACTKAMTNLLCEKKVTAEDDYVQGCLIA